MKNLHKKSNYIWFLHLIVRYLFSTIRPRCPYISTLQPSKLFILQNLVYACFPIENNGFNYYFPVETPVETVKLGGGWSAWSGSRLWTIRTTNWGVDCILEGNLSIDSSNRILDDTSSTALVLWSGVFSIEFKET